MNLNQQQKIEYATTFSANVVVNFVNDPTRLNKMIKYFFILLLTSLMTSCVSYKHSNFYGDKLENKIPNLELRVIESNFETFYSAKTLRTCSKGEISELPNGIFPYSLSNDVHYYADKGPTELTIAKYNMWSSNKPKYDTLKVQKSKPYYRIDDSYLSKYEDFQRKLIAQKKIINLENIDTKFIVDFSNLYYEIAQDMCPDYTSKMELKFNSNSNEQFRGYSNLTVPALIEDIKTIYVYEFNKNICSTGIPSGYCVLKLISDSSFNSPTGLAIFKALTISYFGIPVSKQERNIKIEIDIYSNNGNLIKTYSATGHSKEYCALYWGYGFKNSGLSNSNGQLARASNSRAFQHALIEIKNMIERDHKFITMKLNE